MKLIFQRFWISIAMLWISISTFAYSFQVDGIYYYITDNQKQTVAVTDGNAHPSYRKDNVTIPTFVTYNSSTYRVTSIYAFAFSDCSDMKSVTIPNSVTSIGNNAFDNCSSLKSVTIPNSVTSISKEAFDNCSSLTSVTIPPSVTTIGTAAFYGCTGLKKSAYPQNLSDPFNNGVAVSYNPSGAIIENEFIFGPNKSSVLFAPYTLTGEYTIPNSVTSIGESAFRGCSGLTSVVIPNSVTSIYDLAFSDCSDMKSVTIPNSVTSIGSCAFSNCSGLTSVTIPNSVTSIGGYAFYNCSSLTSVTIPNSVTSIGTEAFFNCSGLTSVTIPNSVTSIGTEAFYECSGLTSVVIPNSVTSIGTEAFYGCSGLTSVVIPNSVTSIGTKAFQGCRALTSVIVPPSVTSIGKFVFYGCSGLKKSAYPQNLSNPFDNGVVVSYNPSGAVIDNEFIFGPNKSSILYAPYTLTGEYTIPNSVTSIGKSAFSGCSGLTSVTIPNSVTSIGESAFYDCGALSSVCIPNSVTSIGITAFTGCNGLKSVIIPNSVTSIGEYAFYNCKNLTEVSSLIEMPFKIDYVFDTSTLSMGTLRVPKGTLAQYKSVGEWNQFANIVEMEDSAINDIGMDDNEEMMDVYTLQGASVLSKAGREQFDKLPSGIYLVKSGNNVKKVMK